MSANESIDVEFLGCKSRVPEEVLRRGSTAIEAHRDEDNLFAIASDALSKKILSDGKNLGRGILKVNSFVNHRVDVQLMDLCGHALAKRFQSAGVTLVLTAQTSGVLPAQACARYLDVPMIFAREKKPITMDTGAYEGKSKSHTRGCDVSLFVASEFLTSADRVLVVDDFLASGTTAVALLDIVRQAGATCVGFAFLIEKSFEGGREALLQSFLEGQTFPIESLADVTSLDDGDIRIATRQ